MRRLAVFALVGVVGCGSAPAVDRAGAAQAPDLGGGAAPDGGPSTATSSRTLTLPGFDVGPGEEKTLCAYVPSDGQEHWINDFVIDMTPGSHHLIAYRVTDTGAPASDAIPCATGLPIGMLPGAQELHTDVALPAGMGMKLGKSEALYFQMHYINASLDGTLHAKVTYTMKEIEKAQVTRVAGEIFYGIWQLNIPTGKSVSSESCKSPSDLGILLATGHMHKHGTAFDALVNATSVFHTDNWDQPSWSEYPDPGFAVKAGDAIAWSCSYDNETGMPLHFGDSASKNEMCIFTAIYYPAPDSQTLFFCQK